MLHPSTKFHSFHQALLFQFSFTALICEKAQKTSSAQHHTADEQSNQLLGEHLAIKGDVVFTACFRCHQVTKLSVTAGLNLLKITT